MDCAKNASLALTQLRQSTLNACWKAIWPACVKTGNLVPEQNVGCSEILILAQAIGGEDFRLG
jgi:hypothetical protein